MKGLPPIELGALCCPRGDVNLTIGYSTAVTWKEVIRKLKAAGFIEKRGGKGSHLLFVHPESGKEVWVTVHGHDAGRLGIASCGMPEWNDCVALSDRL